MENYLVHLRELNLESMVLRIILAMVVGGVVGFDREKKGQAAGFRTYMLVALGAAMTMILSRYMDIMITTSWEKATGLEGSKTDAVRFGAQVINGVGFLGTGTILVTSKSEVKGLTTASGLWASACMGLAVGAGFYEGTLIGFLLIIISMKMLPFIEHAILPKSRNMNIYVEMDSIENIGPIVNYIKKRDITLYDMEINRSKNDDNKNLSAILNLRLPKREEHTGILAKLSTLDGIIMIDEV